MQKIWQFLWRFYHEMASPRYFYQYTAYFIPVFAWLCVGFMLSGLYYGLVIAPPDYQQGDSYRIMFVHVPAAWMSMFVYLFMTILAIITVVWRLKLAEIMGACSAPLGAWFTFLALVTGSIWGKPMWGTWWAWDARLTSELILLFIYLGIIALNVAIEDKRKAAQAAAILTIVGVVNIPIIHYSVVWWNSLHQGASVSIIQGKIAMDMQMFIPLILMALAFKFYYLALVLKRARCEVLYRERNSNWVKDLLNKI